MIKFMGVWLSIRASLLLLTSVISLSMVIFLSCKAKRSKILFTYLLLQTLVFIWSLGQLFEILSVGNDIWGFVCLQSFAIIYICPAWLVLSLQLTCREKYLNKKSIFVLLIPPTFFYLTLLTNNWHHMFYPQYGKTGFTFGAFFWAHLVYCYTSTILGIFLLLMFAFKKSNVEKTMAVYLAIAALAPFISNLLHVFRIIKVNSDITPLSLALSLVFFQIVTFRYRFLNIMPIAIREVFDTLNDPIVIIDMNEIIVDCNSSFEKLFDYRKHKKSLKTSHDFVQFLKTKITGENTVYEILDSIELENRHISSGEITLSVHINTNFLVTIHPVYNKKGKCFGKIVSFNDITDDKKLLANLKSKINELTELYAQLRYHTAIAEQLAVLKERERISRDIHDSLGQTLTLLLKLHEASLMVLRSNPDKAEELINSANKVGKEGFKKLKDFTMGLSIPHLGESQLLLESLKMLILKYTRLGMNVEFHLDGDLESLEDNCSDVIFRICQEALTNSMRHGKATQVNIFLRISYNALNLFIIDNGKSYGKIEKGFGISTMEDRVKKLSGNLQYGSSNGSGFNIHVNIPLYDKDEPHDKNIIG